MSKQNYTPGPWAFDSAHDQVIVESGFGNVAIAETYGEDWEANARLIAAAPEMLEAISAVINSIDNGTPARRTTLDAIRSILINPLNKAIGK